MNHHLGRDREGRNRSRRKLLAGFLLVACGPAVLGGNLIRRRAAVCPLWDVFTVRLPVLKPGLHLVMGSEPSRMAPAPEALALRDGRAWRVIGRLSDLKGAVTIRNCSDALLYVRLRTALPFAWRDRIELEVLSRHGARMYPRYFGQPFEPQSEQSGFSAILSPAAFKAGHFAPPAIFRHGASFGIIRWIYVLGPEQEHVEKVLEYVGRNGGYRRITLSSMAPRRLQDTRWSVPRAM